MEIKEFTQKLLIASQGHILTDGEHFGRVVALAIDRDPSEFHEITEEEYQAIIAKKAEETSHN